MRALVVAALAQMIVMPVIAQAQQAPAPPPSNPAPMGPPPGTTDSRMFDRDNEFSRMRDEVARSEAGPTKSLRPVPAAPEDIVQGREVRDSKGLVVGTLERVGADFAVLAGPMGKIEVDFKSIAKNRDGLMINMRKAKLDAMMGGKPAS